MYATLQDIFWPRDPNWSPVETAKRRVLTAFMAVSGGFGLAEFAVHAKSYVASPALYLPFVAIIAAGLLGPIVARRASSINVISTLFLVVSFAMLVPFLVRNGMTTPGVFMFPVWLVATMLLMGLKGGLVGLCALAALYVWTFQTHHAGNAPTQPVMDDKLVSVALIAAVEIVFFCWIFLREMNLAVSRLEKEQRAALLASKAKTEFLANMSHEIRTPMNGILGMAELLRETPLNERQKLCADTIFSSGNALLFVINDILDFSKIEAGKLQIHLEPFALWEAVEEISILLGETARQKGLALLLRIDPETPRHVVGDVGRLRQVLTNLVGNAIKFTEKGAVKIEVETERAGAVDAGTALVLQVSDTGIGIPASKLEAIFEEFTQAEGSTTRRFGGTGLGLTITKNLVEAMGGTIDVRSKEGSGTTFTVRIVMAAAPEMEAPPAPALAATNSPTPPRLTASPARAKILVADDHEVNRLVIANLIGEEAYDLTFAENGEVAVAAAARTQFDLIMLDISMPVMDGPTAAAAIRAKETQRFAPSTPIIALTAHAMAGDRERFLSGDFDDYLSKPVNRETLHATIQKWLDLTGEVASHAG